MRRFLLIFVIILLSINTILSAKANETKLLQKNIQSWEQFRWQGIIQAQSSAFSIRKNFVLAKSKDAVRLDVLDGGIMGLTAKPLISIYIMDSIVLEAPTIKQLEGIDPNWIIPRKAVMGLVQFSDTLQLRQQEILKERKLVSNQTIYTFDKKYRLVRVTNSESGFRSDIVYNRHNQPETMSFKYLGKPLAELQIVERDYQNIRIEPLIKSSETFDSNQEIPQDKVETNRDTE